jgi:hypothetical protein
MNTKRKMISYSSQIKLTFTTSKGKTKPIIKTNPIKRTHPHISQCQGILIEFAPDELGILLCKL